MNTKKYSYRLTLEVDEDGTSRKFEAAQGGNSQTDLDDIKYSIRSALDSTMGCPPNTFEMLQINGR